MLQVSLCPPPRPPKKPFLMPFLLFPLQYLTVALLPPPPAILLVCKLSEDRDHSICSVPLVNSEPSSGIDTESGCLNGRIDECFDVLQGGGGMSRSYSLGSNLPH